MQIVLVFPNVLQKIKSKYSFYSFPSPIPVIVFRIGGVKSTELYGTAPIKPGFISVQFQNLKNFKGWFGGLLLVYRGVGIVV